VEKDAVVDELGQYLVQMALADDEVAWDRIPRMA
jgi:hypothetical protein